MSGRRFEGRAGRFLVAFAALLLFAALAPANAAAKRNSYDNPLEVRIPGDGLVESCADPSRVGGQNCDPYWYA